MRCAFARILSGLCAAFVITSCDSAASRTTGSLFGSGGANTNAGAGGIPATSGASSGNAPGVSSGNPSAAGAPGSGGSSDPRGSSGSPGFAGSPGGVAGASGAAGNSSGKGSPDASAGTGGAPPADSDAGAADAGASTGVLPPIMDPGATGPFTPATTTNIGPNNNYTSIQPMELGKGGILHPILVWSPGAGAWPAIYQTLLDHIASHGFVVISYNSTAQGPELATAMDWIVGESTRQGSMYFGKVDTKKIAAGGQSAGSLAAFNVAKDARLTTTLHINGGTFAPHTAEMNLVKPAEFICGDDPSVTGGDGTSVSDLARPNCDADFMMATTPVWYGDVIGASHTTIIDNPLGGTSATDPLKKPFLAATVAWLRWLLADDQTMKPLFIGPSCGFCKQTMTWKVQQKDLH